MTNFLRTLWRLLDRYQRRQLLRLSLLSVVMAFSTVGGIAAIVPFLTLLADPNAITHNRFMFMLYAQLHFVNREAFVVALGLGFAGIVLIGNTINLLGNLMLDRFAFRVGDTFHVRLFDEYLRRDYRFHTRSNSAALASRLLHETSRVTSGILKQFLSLLANAITIVFVVASMAILNPLVAIGAIASLGTSYVLIYAVARQRLLRNGSIETRCCAERTQIIHESFGAIRDIILLRVRNYYVRQLAACCRSISRTKLNTLAVSQSPRYILECVVVFCLAGAALYLRNAGNSGGQWVAQLSFLGLAAYRLLPALQQVYSAFVQIRANRSAFDGIAEVLYSSATSGTAKCDAPVLGTLAAGVPREIRFQAASYRYSEDAPQAILDLCLTLPAGSAIGIMGANGSGKTTLVDMLAGLLVPQSGHVEIDGAVLDNSNRAQWQATVAYVPQHVYLLDATLAENIALGVAASGIDTERLRMAVRLACLDDCVAALPRGLQERLGEAGCRLSGGQRQRLGIARALYRNASLLIFDEATSSLDADAEEEILNVLRTLRPGRTIVMIGHRLSALRVCDVIVELRNGSVVRSGPFSEFMRKGTLRAMSGSGVGTDVLPKPGKSLSAGSRRATVRLSFELAGSPP